MHQRLSLPWIFGVSLALFMTLTPYFYYRWHYTTYKRLRVVDDGKLYRSGCLTAQGFEEAVKKYGIRTIVNLQEEAPDPLLPKTPYSSQGERESELCKRLGVNMKFIMVDTHASPDKEPEAIEQFLKVVDDPANYPILLHCRAGLHRTGVLVAMYRMQHHGWSKYQALEELRAHGFGRTASYAQNDYIRQYVIEFRPRSKNTTGRLTSQSK